MSKTNIYGDRHKCISCDAVSDVIEQTKHYCVDCWYKHTTGNTIEEADEKFKSDDQKFKDILNDSN